MNLRLLCQKPCSPLLMFVRFRGKPIGVAKTLSQRLAEENYSDPVLHERFDIGFPQTKPSRSAELRQRLDHLKKQRKDPNLEKLARSKKLKINLEETKKDWLGTSGPFQIRKIADAYGVFEHLFGRYAYFTPRVHMDIKFKLSDESSCPIYYGNRIKPSEAVNCPQVRFDPSFSMQHDAIGKTNDSLWTLVLTNPDGNLTENNKEYVHWMVGNIPNGDVSRGELIVPYLQPFPPKGSGYHRYIFVLYHQDKKMNYQDMVVTEPHDLKFRTFDTYEFYRQRQEELTPAGLSFFQTNWDDTLTSFFHNVLKMKEPIYDYDYPEAFLKEQVYFPKKMPFNLYLDKYNDPKEVNKRYLEQKLAKTHPFEGPEPSLKFPNAHAFGREPSWLKTEIKKNRLGIGRINDIDS